MPKGDFIEYSQKDGFKKDCVNTLIKEENYPLIVIWHTQGKGLGISISDKIQDAKMLAQFLFSKIKFK